MLKINLLVIVALVAHTNAVYNSLEWSSCSTGAQSPAFKIIKLTMLPMVIINENVILNLKKFL